MMSVQHWGCIPNDAYIAPLINPLKATKVMPQAASLAFNSDGTKFAVSAGDFSPDHKIYLTDRDGKSSHTISGQVGGCFEPVFSPDGKHVYFLAEEWRQGPTGDPTMNLMRASITGNDVVEIAPYTLFENLPVP